MPDGAGEAAAEGGANSKQSATWAERLAKADSTHFINDVLLRPSVGPVAGWIIAALIALVIWLTIVYAPGAVEPSSELAGHTSRQVIPVEIGYLTIYVVAVLALVAGWEPIALRLLSERRGRLFIFAALLLVGGGGILGLFVVPRSLAPDALWYGIIGTAFLALLWRSLGPLAQRYIGLGRRLAERPGRTGWWAWLGAPRAAIRWSFQALYRIPSAILSFIDYLLARPIAWLAGATIRFPVLRYGALFAWIFGAAYGGHRDWDTALPIGLIGVGIGMLAILAVVRRWSWVERDREAFLVERKIPEHVRVGFSEDLRDEALTALVFMFLLIPLGLRQIDLTYDAFDIRDDLGRLSNVTPGLWGWAGFFGAELAKSVPFVDWSEVFHVANDSPIVAKTALGAQVVFAMRASLDLLLLAAVLQAVQIGARVRDQRAAFEAYSLPIVDPFAERRVFRALASKLFDGVYAPVWKQQPVEEFEKHKYDGDQLEVIAAGVPPGERPASPILRDSEARRAALAVYARRNRENHKTFGLIEEQLAREPDSSLSRFALTLAQSLDDGRARDLLMQLLPKKDDASPSLRAAAARELGWLREGAASELLLARLRDSGEDPSVKAQAGLALVKLSDSRARDPLIALASRYSVRKRGDGVTPVLAAAYALALLDPKGTPQAIAAYFAKPMRKHADIAARIALGKLAEMVAIQAGSFLMGSPESEEGRWDAEGPQHPVTISAPFEIGKYPLTFEEYDAFCAATGARKPPDAWGRVRQPVINVSWYDAHDFCDWLNSFTGERYRLPAEAEWEYTCRAGTTTRYSWGDEWNAANANGSEDVPGQTTKVGKYPENPWGLHDMHGNVWEWCADPWHDRYNSAPDNGTAWLADGGLSTAVLRGGSWSGNPRNLRSALRGGNVRDFRFSYIGFRLARTLPGQ